MVARTTLCGLADPSDFVRMFVIPADSTTARTAPPAMMPVPSGAGFSNTLPAPKLPTTACGIVVPASGTRTRFFFAASIPFLIADGTSFALPMPKPTTPWPSPTTTRALKLRFLPPLTTFVTRLMDTTVSLISSCAGSIRSRVFMCVHAPPQAGQTILVLARLSHFCVRCLSAASLELQTCLTGCIRNRADPAVIQEPAAIEDHPLDAFVDGALCNDLADRFRALQVATTNVLRK